MRQYLPIPSAKKPSVTAFAGYGFAPVDLREATASEAPICAWQQINMPDPKLRHGSKPKRIAFRAFEGSVWRPSSHPLLPATKPTEQREKERIHALLTDYSAENHPLWPRHASIYALAKRARIETSLDEDDVIEWPAYAFAKRRAEMTMVIDGVLHTRSPGPALSVTHNGSGLRWCSQADPLDHQPERRTNIFGYGDVDGAMTFAATVLGEEVRLDPAFAPEIVGDMPDQSRMLAAGAAEAGAWSAAWVLSTIGQEAATEADVEALLILRKPLSERAALDGLGHGRSHYAAWPYDANEMDFADSHDLVRSLRRVLDLTPGISDRRVETLVRRAVERLDHAPGLAPQADLEALAEPGF